MFCFGSLNKLLHGEHMFCGMLQLSREEDERLQH